MIICIAFYGSVLKDMVKFACSKCEHKENKLVCLTSEAADIIIVFLFFTVVCAILSLPAFALLALCFRSLPKALKDQS